MHAGIKISGVVLAGGLARRMQQQDKGLIEFKSKPMVSYAITNMTTCCDELFINANRNIAQYEEFSYPVISDKTDSFDGPLAGMLVAMEVAKHEILLVMPCDSPFFLDTHLRCLVDGLLTQQAQVAVAFDGERLHPVFLALKTSLRDSLYGYLQQGKRKIDHWLMQHECVKIDFSNQPQIFQNINTLDELTSLQSKP